MRARRPLVAGQRLSWPAQRPGRPDRRLAAYVQGGVPNPGAVPRAVVATHSAARALADHTRNLSDAELDAIKAGAGGIGAEFNHGEGIGGFRNESQAPNITRELAARGYSEAQVAQI